VGMLLVRVHVCVCVCVVCVHVVQLFLATASDPLAQAPRSDAVFPSITNAHTHTQTHTHSHTHARAGTPKGAKWHPGCDQAAWGRLPRGASLRAKRVCQ